MGAASQKNRKKTADYLTLIPLISVIAVVPLVFRLYRYDTGLSGYDYYAADGTADDFALHGKMVLFTILSSVMAIVAVIKFVREKKKIRLVDLLEQCGQQRVFVTMDLEGNELDVLKEAQEYLQAAKSPITLAVCAYHRTTDYEDLKRFFEAIGYHTETQSGYVYTDMNDGHGIHSLRKCLIRASNVCHL